MITIKESHVTEYSAQITLSDGKMIYLSPNEEYLYMSFSFLGDNKVDARSMAANIAEIHYIPMNLFK